MLAGRLRDIKKEYGKNRLMLAAENLSLEELTDRTQRKWADLVSVSDRKKDFLILELKEGANRKGVMAALAASDVEVERFGSYEPSLNDIFVLKVGEEE